MKKILILLILATGITWGCKEKKQTPPPVPKKKVEVKKEPVVEEVAEPELIDEGVDIDDQFFVIINSYTVPEIAFEKLEMYKKQGYKPMVLMRDENGFFSLALKSFDDYNQALSAAEELRMNDEFAGTWVMKRSGHKIEDKGKYFESN